MSVVSTVVIVGYIPDRLGAHIRAFKWDSREANFGPKVDPCGGLVGGSKCAESDIIIGGFNYFPAHEFFDHLDAYKWASTRATYFDPSGADPEIAVIVDQEGLIFTEEFPRKTELAASGEDR